MPYIKVYIHFVFTTKNREPLLNTRKIRETVWKHIYQNAHDKGIYIDFIGGYDEHCHCLVSLGTNQSMKYVMQMIKGESSFWINKNKICEDYFNWQNDYFAVSVSESDLNRVRDYIKNQGEPSQE
jgi:putative transposase